MFFSGLLQYNSAGESFGSDLRLRWEYSPGSELFVVYTDDRGVTGGLRPDRSWDLRNRAASSSSSTGCSGSDVRVCSVRSAASVATLQICGADS